jgi:hypothetical protein
MKRASPTVLMVIASGMLIVSASVLAQVTPASGTIVGSGGHCLGITSGSLQDSALLIASPCTGAPSQRFNIIRDPSNGSMSFIAQHSNKCLDVPGADIKDGTPIQQYSCDGSPEQHFMLVSPSFNQATNQTEFKGPILTTHSNKCFDTRFAPAVQQISCDMSFYQNFTVALSPATGANVPPANTASSYPDLSPQFLNTTANQINSSLPGEAIAPWLQLNNAASRCPSGCSVAGDAAILLNYRVLDNSVTPAVWASRELAVRQQLASEFCTGAQNQLKFPLHNFVANMQNMLLGSFYVRIEDCARLASGQALQPAQQQTYQQPPQQQTYRQPPQQQTYQQPPQQQTYQQPPQQQTYQQPPQQQTYQQPPQQQQTNQQPYPNLSPQFLNTTADQLNASLPADAIAPWLQLRRAVSRCPSGCATPGEAAIQLNYQIVDTTVNPAIWASRESAVRQQLASEYCSAAQGQLKFPLHNFVVNSENALFADFYIRAEDCASLASGLGLQPARQRAYSQQSPQQACKSMLQFMTESAAQGAALTTELARQADCWVREAKSGSKNLAGAILAGQNYYRADFSGADLSGASLHGSNLSESNLSGANLSGANFAGADLSNANLSMANLNAATVSSATTKGVDFNDWIRRGGNVDQAPAAAPQPVAQTQPNPQAQPNPQTQPVAQGGLSQIPGANFLGRNINLLKGEVNPGARMLIEPLSDSEIESVAGAGDLRSHTTEATSASEAASSYSTTIGLKGHYGAFSASSEIGFSKDIKERSQTRIVTVTIEVPLAQVSIKSDQLKLTSEFSQALNNSNVAPQSLFDSYGTHLVFAIGVGGRATGIFSTKDNSRETNEKLKVSAEASFAAVSGSVSTESTSGSKLATHQMSDEWVFKGGENQFRIRAVQQRTPQNYQIWAASVDRQPGISRYDKLKPIWELAASQTRRTELENAFMELYTHKSLVNLERFVKQSDGVNVAVDLTVPRNYKILSGGAKVNYTGYGSLLTESWPDGTNTWQVNHKNHFEVDAATSQAFVMAVFDPFDLLDVRIFRAKSSGPSEHLPRMEVAVGSGYQLVGGGAKVYWSGSGNLLTASYPDGGKWIATSKDHGASSGAHIEAFAIGLKYKNGSGPYRIETHTNDVTSSMAHQPSATASVQFPYRLVGGGAWVHWEGGDGNLLTESYPEAGSWKAKSKDHRYSSGATITSYAIGLKVSPVLPDWMNP